MMKNMTAIENQINALYAQYMEECEDISQACIEEGYPSHGSNYELRCENLWRDYHDEITALEEELEEEKAHHLFVPVWELVEWPDEAAPLFNEDEWEIVPV